MDVFMSNLGRFIFMAKKKDVSITVLMTEEQRERWKKYAEQKDMSVGSFVRNCVEAYISASERLRKQSGNG